MTSLEPKVKSVAESQPAPSNKVTLASLFALVASLGGNVLQWQTNAAELSKVKAETASLVQQQRENETKSAQSWIEQLQKFATVEDRVMVLSAAMSTTPYDSVRQWAKDQMLRMEGELATRKAEVSAEVALTETLAPGAKAGEDTTAHAPPPPQGGSGASTPHAVGPTKPPTTAPVAASAVVESAKTTLDRVSLAESMLKAAKVRAVMAPPSR